MFAGDGAYHFLRGAAAGTEDSVNARTLGVAAADTLKEATRLAASGATCPDDTVFVAATGAARVLLLLAAVGEDGNEDAMCCFSSRGSERRG